MRLSVLLWLCLPFLVIGCEGEEDTDGDGINDGDDPCPRQEEDNRWSFEDESDGCPDGLSDLARLAEFDVDGFWERTAQNFQLPYEGPNRIVAYTDETDTPCGPAVPNNAFYCALDHRIYYHEPFVDRQLDQIGDFAVVFVIAHEWGHLVQANLGLLSADTFTIALELQADCFAGAYTADADERGLLEQGDADEGVVALMNAGDPAGVPWFSPWRARHARTASWRFPLRLRRWHRGLHSTVLRLSTLLHPTPTADTFCRDAIARTTLQGRLFRPGLTGARPSLTAPYPHESALQDRHRPCSRV